MQRRINQVPQQLATASLSLLFSILGQRSRSTWWMLPFWVRFLRRWNGSQQYHRLIC